jgi:hypothetical protein
VSRATPLLSSVNLIDGLKRVDIFPNLWFLSSRLVDAPEEFEKRWKNKERSNGGEVFYLGKLAS